MPWHLGFVRPGCAAAGGSARPCLRWRLHGNNSLRLVLEVFQRARAHGGFGRVRPAPLQRVSDGTMGLC